MPRYRLLIEYDGTGFSGWQRQAGLRTLQAEVETALTACTGEAPTVVAAGRTDAGVHALGQVAHVDLAKTWLPERIVAATNAHLRPLPVSVVEARQMPHDFHARFSAVRRHYLYRLLSRRAPPALERDRVWHVPVPLSVTHMHEAAQALRGRHDFTSFRARDCQAASAVKTLDLIHVRGQGALIEVRLAARSFLHHQVRNIVGTLKLVGEGRARIGFVREVLSARDRAAAGQTAPACGLYLERVDYP